VINTQSIRKLIEIINEGFEKKTKKLGFSKTKSLWQEKIKNLEIVESPSENWPEILEWKIEKSCVLIVDPSKIDNSLISIPQETALKILTFGELNW
jgi:hypothetical protein